MIAGFQKQTILVMFIFIGILLLFGGIGFIYNGTTKPIDRQIKQLILGDSVLECLKSANITMGENTEGNIKVKELQTKLNFYTVLFLIVDLGILYLGSGLIVRLIHRSKFNNKIQYMR